MNPELKAKVDEMNQMILNGQLLEAFEKFYHEDCVMMERNQVLAEGKDANREREKEFLSKVTEFRGAHVHNVAVGDDVTMVEWHFDYDHADWGTMKYDQVAVQKWKDGHIVHERFYALYGL